MKKSTLRFLHTSGIFLLLTASQANLADDTDIFLGNNQTTLAPTPNILFIMDDSGSMGSTITVNVATYDSTATYANTFNDNNLYYVFDGLTFVGAIPVNDFTCQDAIDEMTTDGGGFANLAEQVGTSTSAGVKNWDDPSFSDTATYTDASGTSIPATRYTIECQEDQGIHGATTSSGDKYTGFHGWSSSSTNQFNWNTSFSEPYTIVNLHRANWIMDPNAATNKTVARFTVLQDVLHDLIGDLDLVNVGLMGFRDVDHGGRIHMPINNINSGTTRTDFVDAINGMPTRYCENNNCAGNKSTTYVPGWFPKLPNWTPLTETLYEAMLYFKGDTAKFSGLTSTPTAQRSHADAFVAAGSNQFKSPITEACQPNFAILLTDGSPTRDVEVNNDVPNLPHITDCSAGYSNKHGKCIDELAGYMAGNDATAVGGADWTDTDINAVIDEKQTVKVYPIGFDNANLKALMDDIAAMAGTKSYTANDAVSLKAAFIEIIGEALETETTFVSPAVSVSASNQLRHSDNVYFALFRPSEYTRWHGNLKKYKIAVVSNPTNTGFTVEIQGIDDSGNYVKAINDGLTLPSSRNLWTAQSEPPDGTSIIDGGYAHELTASRKVYTYLGNSANLTDTSNDVAKTNTAITKTMMGIGSQPDAYRDELLDWTNGMDTQDWNGDGSTTDPNFYVADPLHSKPVVVNYDAANYSNPDSVLFFGDNMGMLHAVDTDDGREIFSYLPEELLPNIDKFYQNSASSQKVYGLDGPVTVWVNDVNGDGDVQDTNEFIYLYVGMRRGGRNYYVLDVTNKTAPKFKYQISGGQGPSAGVYPDFHELGQTWSAPKLAKIRWGCSGTTGCGINDYKEVMFFGGGYDGNQDISSLQGNSDSMGRAIYMIDPRNGDKLWSAGPNSTTEQHDYTNSEMTNSMVADLSVIDLDGDGFHDTLFATDIMGQVWRFDFNKEYTGTGDILVNNGSGGGGIIADLSNKSTVSSIDYEHRFFSAPDVAFFNQTGKKAYVTVSLGSGYRPSPLSTTMEDWFYSFKDYNVFNPPVSYNYYKDYSNPSAVERRLKGSDLGVSTATGASFTFGWRRQLTADGEKSLSRSVTFNNEVAFTTFHPTPTGATLCSGDVGIAQYYFVNAANGKPTRNLDTSDDTTGNIILNASATLPSNTGIPPEPAVVFVDGTRQVKQADGSLKTHKVSEGALCIGLNCIKAELEPVNKSFWRVNEK